MSTGFEDWPLLNDYLNICSCLYEKPEDYKRTFTENIGNVHEHDVFWKVITDVDTLDGEEVLRQCRVLTGLALVHPLFDPVPRSTDYYFPKYKSVGDPTSYPATTSVELEQADCGNVWRIHVHYAPPETIGAEMIWDRPYPGNPFSWPIHPWIEIVEEQTVVEKATCLSKLKYVERGPGYSTHEPGPVINAAGQQTIDPITDIEYRIKLNVKVNYPTIGYAMGLNFQFRRTVHGPPQLYAFSGTPEETYYGFYQWDSSALDFLYGMPHGTWRYVVASPEKPQWRANDAGTAIIEYVPTTITIENRLGNVIDRVEPTYLLPVYEGWLKMILNNGQTCFKKWRDNYLNQDSWIPDPRFQRDDGGYDYRSDGSGMPVHPLLVPTSAMQLQNPDDLTYKDPRGTTGLTEPRPFPKAEDINELPSAEPMNLNLDGSQITDPAVQPNHLAYAPLTTKDFFDITNYHGAPVFDASLFIPSFPLPPVIP